uniref:Uncharacterized protein n=1 Tax=Lotharella globosa TaxID=91324 RepID=A0A7S4DZE0_9EUKA
MLLQVATEEVAQSRGLLSNCYVIHGGIKPPRQHILNAAPTSISWIFHRAFICLSLPSVSCYEERQKRGLGRDEELHRSDQGFTGLSSKTGSVYETLAWAEITYYHPQGPIVKLAELPTGE